MNDEDANAALGCAMLAGIAAVGFVAGAVVGAVFTVIVSAVI